LAASKECVAVIPIYQKRKEWFNQCFALFSLRKTFFYFRAEVLSPSKILVERDAKISFLIFHSDKQFFFLGLRFSAQVNYL
jgi:hypothetical protein